MPGNGVFYRRTQSILKSEWEWDESMKGRTCVLGRYEALDDQDVEPAGNSLAGEVGCGVYRG